MPALFGKFMAEILILGYSLTWKTREKKWICSIINLHVNHTCKYFKVQAVTGQQFLLAVITLFKMRPI